MTDYIPDPFKNYKMKGTESPPRMVGQNIVDEQTLARLGTMEKSELVALVKRMARQCGFVAMMSEDDIRQAFLDRMAHIGLTGKAQEALAAIEKRMDRVEGKAMQRQQSLVAVADASKPLPENDRQALEHYFKIRGLSIASV